MMFVRTLPVITFMGVVLFASAGRLDLPATLLSNPYASSAVRIQTERAQRVITTGPYAIVRHPMYTGVVFCCAGGGMALGSWWSALALVPVVAVFVRRTLIEDRMLHAELPGYAAYARKVPSRLIPGLF